MTILCLRLNDGAELIAEVEETPTGYIAKDVLQLLSVHDEDNGQLKMAIVPFAPHTTGQFAIPFGMAIAGFPNDDVENMYKQRFGKIITPKSKIVL